MGKPARQLLRDRFFKNLYAAIRAKLERRGSPLAKRPIRRPIRQVAYAGVASAIVGFTFNVLGVQDWVCGVPIFQPGVSDLCGALALGHRAKRAERIEWESREPGSCAALRIHIEHYPEGAYRDAAADLLAARRMTQVEVWTPATPAPRLTMFVGQDGTPAGDSAAAQAAALERAKVVAERLCRGFAATTLFRLTSAQPAVQVWNCGRVSRGVVCGFEGEAVCSVEERRVKETESCER